MNQVSREYKGLMIYERVCGKLQMGVFSEVMLVLLDVWESQIVRIGAKRVHSNSQRDHVKEHISIGLTALPTSLRFASRSLSW